MIKLTKNFLILLLLTFSLLITRQPTFANENTEIITSNSIFLNKSYLSLEVNRYFQLEAVAESQTAYDFKLIWKSSNQDIVEVNNEGKIFSKSFGKAIITVLTEDGASKAFCEIDVYQNAKTNPIVAIDPSHSMVSPGLQTPPIPDLDNKVIKSHEFNRRLAELLTYELESNNVDTIDVTEGITNIEIPLIKKTDLANNYFANKFNQPADIYIALGFDLLSDFSELREHGPNGFTIYTHDTKANSKDLANIIEKYRVQSVYPQTNRGIQSDKYIFPNVGFHVLRETIMPSVLVINGFMDYKSEALLMANEIFIADLATLYAKAICEYFSIDYHQPVNSLFTQL